MYTFRQPLCQRVTSAISFFGKVRMSESCCETSLGVNSIGGKLVDAVSEGIVSFAWTLTLVFFKEPHLLLIN